MTSEKAKKWLGHQIKYWWAFGIIAAAIMMTLLAFYGKATPDRFIIVAIVGFLNGGVMLRLIAKFNLDKIDKQKNNTNE